MSELQHFIHLWLQEFEKDMKDNGMPIKVNSKELEYWCTLDWDSLMSYLEKKFGEKFKNKIRMSLQATYQASIGEN